MGDTNFLIGLIRSLGYAALIALAFAVIIEHVKHPAVRAFAAGALFSLAGVVSMSDPVTLASGRITDARTVVIVLASAFGGPVSASITGFVLAGYRFALGGEGAQFGAIGIVAMTVASVLFTRLPARAFRTKWLRLAAHGTAASIAPLILAPIPNTTIHVVALPLLVSIVTANVVGVVVIGYFLDREKKRITLKRALEDAAGSDPLTKLANRRALEDRAQPVFRGDGNHTHPVALIMLDVDHFKRINDRWGHHIGDEVLIKIADTLRATVRKTDFVARFGGEEMIVLMPSASLDIAHTIAERIRNRITELDFSHVDEDLTVTLSAGIASTSQRGDDFRSVLKAADSALYRAKSEGRNRVVAAAV